VPAIRKSYGVSEFDWAGRLPDLSGIRKFIGNSAICNPMGSLPQN
jgi:hypothetical protein